MVAKKYIFINNSNKMGSGWIFVLCQKAGWEWTEDEIRKCKTPQATLVLALLICAFRSSNQIQ